MSEDCHESNSTREVDAGVNSAQQPRGQAGRRGIVLRQVNNHGQGMSLDPIVRQDIETVTAFILGYWPGYEDAISWGDDLDASDYDWYVAAQRLKVVLANAFPLNAGVDRQEEAKGENQP